jgi:hypothetical protein
MLLRKTSTPLARILVVQILAGAVVPIAHARERETAAASIEARHDASCVVIHDAMRCALCLYAGSLAAPPSGVAPAVGASTPLPRGCVELALPVGRGTPAVQPRAPPALS